MARIRRFLIALLLTVTVFAPTLSEAKRDRVLSDFKSADINGDNMLSRAEWNRRGNFDVLDQNGDGSLSIAEVRKMYEGHDDHSYPWPPTKTALTFPGEEIDTTIKDDRLEKDALDKETLCGIGRSKRCPIGPQLKRGLMETGTGPLFPKHANCFGIDDYWAMDYAHKRDKQSYHGGIDIPAPWGTPMLAIASGAVVAMYEAHQSKRGNEVILRHSPEDTGLPIWVYSGYGHLDRLPDLKIGQRIRMGDIIGPTGNSGISARGGGQSTSRRPAIHLATWFAPVPQYSEAQNTIIPIDGRWLDPFALYRQQPPYLTQQVKTLPDADKSVAVPIMFEDATTWPTSTKLIWPYACSHR